MKSRRAERIFLGIAAVVLALPLVQMLTGIVPLEAINEKRRRYEVPQLAERLMRLDATLAADVNRWFDDRYGFRDLLIRMKNQIDYTLFRGSAKVAIGPSDWLFLRDHATALVSYERAGDAWRAELVGKFGTIARYLEGRGIGFIVLRVAEKGDFHPERRVRDLPRLPAITQVQKLGQELAAMPGLVYLDGGAILAQARDGRALYRKTDIHFTYGAARILTQALVDKIAELEGHPALAPARDFNAVPLTLEGDLGPFVAKLVPVRELDFYYDNQFAVDQDTDEGRWDKDASRVELPGWGSVPLFDFIFRSNPAEGRYRLPTTVLFGNSFADMFFGVGIQTYFTEFYRARNVPPRFAKSLANLPPGTKHVIYQFFDPFLGGEFPLWDLSELAEDRRLATH